MSHELVHVLLAITGIATLLFAVPLPPSRMHPAYAPRRISVAERIGHGLRHRVGLAPAADAVARRWGRSVWAALLVIVHPALAFVVLGALWTRPVLAHRRAQRLDDTEVWESVPEVANVMALAVRSGATVEQAMGLVGERVPGVGGQTFKVGATQLRAGALMSDVLSYVGETLGDPVRPLCRAVVSSMVGGTELVPALERVAEELARHHHQRKLRQAHRVPVALLFPLVVCTLPAFALLTVVPLIATSVGQLTG